MQGLLFAVNFRHFESIKIITFDIQYNYTHGKTRLQSFS